MYFWNIKELKEKLKEKPLSDYEIFPYLILTIAFELLPYSSSWSNYNKWDYFSEIHMFLIPILGLIYTYHQNKGKNGTNFLQRYFSLNWVLGIRFLIPIITLMIVVLAIDLFIVEFLNDETSWYESVTFMLLEIIFYYRLGVHIKDVATHTESNSYNLKEP